MEQRVGDYTNQILRTGLVCAFSILFFFPFFTHAASTTGVPACDVSPTPRNCLSFDPAVNPILKNGPATLFCAAGKADANGYCKTTDASHGTCQDYTIPQGILLPAGNYTFCTNGTTLTWDTTSSIGAIGSTDGTGIDTTVTKTQNGDPTQNVETPVSKVATAATENAACSIATFKLGDCLQSILAAVIAEIEWVILLIVSAILGIANYLLGWTVYVTVYQFGALIGNSKGLLDAWGVVRDVANILLLFGFIFMGISTILNLPHSEFTAKRALPTLLIFALLLNFSLLAAEGIVDVSNAFAVSIYNQIGGVCPETAGTIDCATNLGIGGRIMQMSGITGIWTLDTLTGTDGKPVSADTRAIIYGGLIVFAVITTIVIVAAAVMLIIRALILALLMVTAPIGFAGMAVPPLQEMAKKWWTQLIHQAFFAPIYFLLVLVSISVMHGVMTALGNGNATNASLATLFSQGSAHGQVSNITIGITFALLIGFMIASLIFAKQSAAIGTSTAVSYGGKFAFGTLGWVGRNTAGRASYRAGYALKATTFGQSKFGSYFVKNLDKVGKASFDGRAVGPGKALAGAVGNLGTANKGGYDAAVHHHTDEQKKYAKSLRKTPQQERDQSALENRERTLKGQKDAAVSLQEQRMSTLTRNLKDQDDTNKAKREELKPVTDNINAGTAQVATLQTQIDAKLREQETARASGDIARGAAVTADLTKLQEEQRTAQAALDSYQTVRNTLQGELDAGIEASRGIANSINDARTTHAAAVKEMDREAEALKGKIKDAKNAPQIQFAENIEKKGLLAQSYGLATGVANVGNEHAAHEIIREVRKDDNQKLLDAIGGFQDRVGSGSPPPPPAAGVAAGGGGH